MNDFPSRARLTENSAPTWLVSWVDFACDQSGPMVFCSGFAFQKKVHAARTNATSTAPASAALNCHRLIIEWARGGTATWSEPVWSGTTVNVGVATTSLGPSEA